MQRGSEELGDSGGKSKLGATGSSATEIGGGVNKNNCPKLHAVLVSVPQPSRSRITSDGMIQPFPGRSRSSSGKIGQSGSGNSGWIKAELYLTDVMLCYDIQQHGQVISVIFYRFLFCVCAWWVRGGEGGLVVCV